MKKCLITGGAGFIGINLVKLILSEMPETYIRILDKRTYAANNEILDIAEQNKNVEVVVKDVNDIDAKDIRGCDYIFHLAAETHVDRSIEKSSEFVKTNVLGTDALLDRVLHYGSDGLKCVVHVSTDEVYGVAPLGTSFSETAPLSPRNPYSASKAGAEYLAMSYYTTYGLPVVVTRPANNYGEYQYPEKLIPLFVWNAVNGRKLPVYGNGLQIRDWLHVSDHCRSMLAVATEGDVGTVYNIPAGNEHTNMEVVELLLDELGLSDSIVEHVDDRLGHDVRYSMSSEKISSIWEPSIDWESGMRQTIRWYAERFS